MKSFLLIISICFGLFSCSSQADSTTIEIIETESLKTAIQEPNIQLLDVRTPWEYNKGKIGNAINANIYSSDFESIILNLDRNKPVYIYCHKGKRSNNAAKKLADLGFKKIYDYRKGWAGWRKK